MIYPNDGYIAYIKDHPKDILLYIDDTSDLFFIYIIRDMREEEFMILVYDEKFSFKKLKYP